MPERAEIEAGIEVLRAMLGDVLGTDEEVRDMALGVLLGAERVRDARGDDETSKLADFQEGLTRSLNRHGVPAMPSWDAAIDWLAEHYCRSPQGEDHETRDEQGRRLYPTVLHGEAATAARLAEHSPSRDGTVTVEDVERLVEALRNFGIHAETCPRHRLFAECTCGLEAVLAEFGSARAGESDEGGNQ